MFLTFEQQNNLVKQGLAKRSDNARLSTFKYARKVMYDYLWDKHPELLECRGHTYDNVTGELIIAAPRKTFNYLENGTWADKPLNTKVTAYKKYNGFMACASIYNNEMLLSTTGSTKSDYVKLAQKHIEQQSNCFVSEGWTWLYEVVDRSDPHIVDEGFEDSRYLGCRNNFTGVFTPSDSTKEYKIKTISDAIRICKIDRGEGFMLYDEQGNCCKMKTEYYIGKKKLMRMPKSKVEQMWKNPKQVQDALPNYWKGVVEYLLSSQDCSAWMEMTDQQRRKELERFV